MAIGFRDVASNSGINGGDVTVTLPGTVQAGDFVLAFGGHARFAAVQPGISSSGWTNGTPFGSATAPGRVVNWGYKFMGGTPDTDFVGIGSGDAQDAVSYIALIFTGVDTSNPLDVAAVTSNGGTSGTPNSPSATPASNGAWAISFGASRQLDAASTPPAGYSNTINVDYAHATADDTTDFTVMGAYKDLGGASAGVPEDPAAWSGITVNGHCAMTVILRPSAGGGGIKVGRLIDGGLVNAGLIGGRLVAARHRIIRPQMQPLARIAA